MTTEPAPPATIRWGLGDAVVGFLIGFFAQAIAGSVVYASSGNQLTLGAIAAGGRLISLAVVRTILVTVAASLIAGLVAHVIDQLLGLESLTRNWGGGGSLLRLFVLGLIMVPIIYAPLIHASHNIQDKLDKPAKDLVDLVHGNGGVVVLTLLVVVGAPIVEELFFRGLLLRSLARRLGSGWAVAISAVAFGVAHQQLLQLPALVALGVVLGILAVKTGRIGPGICTHMAFNAVTIVYLVHAR